MWLSCKIFIYFVLKKFESVNDKGIKKMIMEI